MARSLIKHMAWLAAASLLGAAARHLWARRLGGPERRRDLRGAVQRWEDEGGLVPEVEAQTPAAPAPARRSSARGSSSANGTRRSRKPRAAAGTAAAQG
ncbi:UNVERIFIED_ORG: hypothetical protein LHJ69_13610 [Shinella sp. XGS7]|nr:hypothetical protein [Shinella sp. XGS7]